MLIEHFKDLFTSIKLPGRPAIRSNVNYVAHSYGMPNGRPSEMVPDPSGPIVPRKTPVNSDRTEKAEEEPLDESSGKSLQTKVA